MAAAPTHTESDMTTTLRTTAPVHGVLFLTGYGVRVAVNRGHLELEGGIADDRWRQRIGRVDRTVKRLVVLGESGSLTLDAIGWLHRVGIPLIHLRPDGTVLLVAAPSAASHAPVRRAQALAAETGLGLRVSLDLITTKIARQAELLATLPGSVAASRDIAVCQTKLEQVRTSADLRSIEGHAAKVYWSAWQALPIQLSSKDLKRCPDHWRQFTARSSPLSKAKSPRYSVNPANAVLNYCYGLLEAEARLAALAVGLDPMVGLLHSDHGTRDSLALDLMEPVRPLVDAYVIDLLRSHVFTRAEVFETVEGQCRLLPPLTRLLTHSMPRWARAVLPVAQHLARELLHDAQAHQDQESPKTTRRVRSHLRVAREYSPRLTKQEDARYQVATVRKRTRSVDQVRRANQRWERTGHAIMTRETYLRDVVPKLRTRPLSDLMAVTGLTNASCSKIRRGLSVPHPRHWEHLARLT